jgi:hypothetical protein
LRRLCADHDRKVMIGAKCPGYGHDRFASESRSTVGGAGGRTMIAVLPKKVHRNMHRNCGSGGGNGDLRLA